MAVRKLAPGFEGVLGRCDSQSRLHLGDGAANGFTCAAELVTLRNRGLVTSADNEMHEPSDGSETPRQLRLGVAGSFNRAPAVRLLPGLNIATGGARKVREEVLRNDDFIDG
jgi:hypothetical protein